MKAGIHPENYRLVVFKDMSNEYSFLTNSCAPSADTIKWEDGTLDFLVGGFLYVNIGIFIPQLKSRYGHCII